MARELRCLTGSAGDGHLRSRQLPRLPREQSPGGRRRPLRSRDGPPGRSTPATRQRRCAPSPSCSAVPAAQLLQPTTALTGAASQLGLLTPHCSALYKGTGSITKHFFTFPCRQAFASHTRSVETSLHPIWILHSHSCWCQHRTCFTALSFPKQLRYPFRKKKHNKKPKPHRIDLLFSVRSGLQPEVASRAALNSPDNAQKHEEHQQHFSSLFRFLPLPIFSQI